MAIKIQKGSVKETALEVAPFAMQLLDPELITNPILTITKVSQAVWTYFVKKFLSEYKEGIKNKKFKAKQDLSEKPALIFLDLLKTFDKSDVDTERFATMKAIFFMSVEKNATQKQEENAYRFFQIAKQLSSEEILILKACYDIINVPMVANMPAVTHTEYNVSKWAQIISQQIGHQTPSLVLAYEKHLIELHLITDKKDKDTRHLVLPTEESFHPTQFFRMTDLGNKLCEFITKYG